MNRYIKLPDAIFRYKLSASAFMVYVALQKHANVFGRCIVKHSTLAQLTGVSCDTVARATRQLESKGLIFIHACKNKRTGDRIANGYTLESFSGGYTKLPACIFAYTLPKSVFKVYAYLLKCRDKNSSEAVPSLSQMVAALHMSKRTIIDATAYLQAGLYLHKARYQRKTDRRIGHNRHFILTPRLRAVMLRLVALLGNVQRKMRATLQQRATRTANRTCLIHSISVQYLCKKYKGFLSRRLLPLLI